MEDGHDHSAIASSSKEPVGQNTPAHHGKYYFDDEMSIFLVENTLFKVHRHYLVRESDFFRSLFSCPVPPGEKKEGSSDQCPIPLHGVRASEFETLLDYFYDGLHPDYEDATTPLPKKKKGRKATEAWKNVDGSIQQLIDLLSIATRYDFERVRTYAIESIGACRKPLDPVERIGLAERYDIPQWLESAYEDLCVRQEPLKVHEAEHLGLTKSVLVAEAREALRRTTYQLNPYYTQQILGTAQQFDPALVSRIVQQVFFPA
ncbi:hypothetical protein BDQ12DRAFT_692754 [Crucibulum laeve]|uniref:BTB domain-containing protein n=1 Tax=Crucibulum laeve TaxID=68775 RepID=A0A5C3LHW3_9AGAR|nr:hypothetical protein BDQ12DRAFT_692754 [Crucibulum laeve]